MDNQLTKSLFVPLESVINFPFYPRIPTISLELTAQCNLRCPYCLNATLQRPKETIAWELLEKIIDEAADGKLNISNLHGAGEPLLWDRLEEVVRLIKSRNAGLASFGTNATLLTQERFRSLLEAGLTQIYFSIDTLDSEIYKATRGGSLEVAVRNVKAAIRLAPKDFKFIIALMNHKDQILTQAKVDEFYEVFGRHTNVLLNPVENEYFPGTQEDYRVTPLKKNGCWAPSGYLFIAADGRAAICCTDQNVKHCLGNVKERSIRDIWFDHRNQTLFRNLAVGVIDVPSVCTQECVLNPPETGRSSVAVGLGLSFDAALKISSVLAMNREFKAALEIAHHLLARDSQNAQLHTFIAEITSHMAS